MTIGEWVRAHVGQDLERCSLLNKSWPFLYEADLQRALDAFCSRAGVTSRAYGPVLHDRDPVAFSQAPTLTELIALSDAGLGGVELRRVSGGVGQHVLCLQDALLLVHAPQPIAVRVRTFGFRPYGERVVEVLAAQVGTARDFLDEISRLMAERSILRGQHLRLRSDGGTANVEFLPRPQVRRGELVLPEHLLRRIDRQATGVGTHTTALAAAGRHVKRGLLLHGPPGTGKTHTVGYIATQMPTYTFLVLTGSGMAWLPTLPQLLPALAPVVVVLDDVDLVAEDRDGPGLAPRDLLFALLEVMDGIAGDADVLFVCTTNRLGSVESAVAARPGRIDEVIEFSRPDRAARLALLHVHGQGLDVDPAALAEIADETEGVTAAFLTELLRRAALATEGTVGASDLRAALDELVDEDADTVALFGAEEAATVARRHRRGIGDVWCGF